jgi:hypothetical protein
LAIAALLGRNRHAVTSFEQWALPLLLVLAVSGVRHIVWFELAAAVSLPRLLDDVWPAEPPTAAVRKVNVALVLLVVPVAALLVAMQLAKPSARLEPAPVAAAAAIAAAAVPGTIVVADDTRADWLLWHEPTLTGRVAYDVRFELFDDDELVRLVSVQQLSSAFWRRCGPATARFGAVAEVVPKAACSL